MEINARQTGILLFLCILANKFLLLPSLMFKQTKNDAIFVLIILFVFDIVALPIFFKLKRKYPDEKLFQILSKKLTKTVTIIIYLVFAFYFLIKAILTVDVVYSYLKQQVYQGDFFLLALISIIPVVNHAVLKGVRVMSRTMEIFFFIIIAGFLTCLGLSLFTNFSMPVFFTSSVRDILSSIYKNTFAFGDFIFLFLIIDKVKLKKNDEKIIYSYSFFAIFLIILLFFIYYAKFQETSFIHNAAISDILVFSVQFNAIGRLDIISMITIIFITTFELEIFSFGFCDSISNLIPMANKQFSIIFLDVMGVLLYTLYFGRYEYIINSFSSWLFYIAIIINYLLPTIFYFISLDYKKKGKKKLEIQNEVDIN